MHREREIKQAMARNFRQAGMSLREIAVRLDVSRETVRLWCMDAAKVFHEEAREKVKCRPKTAVGKKKPRHLITPSGPWWREAPPLVHVCIVTGQVLVHRWPLE
ncbi:MAG: hypothetical protein PWP72_808 [Thermoanaerobacter sp.]|jgi:transposase-like protein|nr:hypothetical protein [Thermoanaerobacter sp.]